jgi:uncharacterized protein YlaI
MKEVKCAMCGYVGFIHPYVAWNNYGHKWPEVFICDECKEW